MSEENDLCIHKVIYTDGTFSELKNRSTMKTLHMLSEKYQNTSLGNIQPRLMARP
jgi:hypothetical protein